MKLVVYPVIFRHAQIFLTWIGCQQYVMISNQDINCHNIVCTPMFWVKLFNITPSHFPIDTTMRNTLKICIIFGWNFWYHKDSCGSMKHWCGIKLRKILLMDITYWNLNQFNEKFKLIINEQVLSYGERVLNRN